MLCVNIFFIFVSFNVLLTCVVLLHIVMVCSNTHVGVRLQIKLLIHLSLPLCEVASKHRLIVAFPVAILRMQLAVVLCYELVNTF